MTLPLYNELQMDANDPINHLHHNKYQAISPHMGLWFERFYNAYPNVKQINPQAKRQKEEAKWLGKFQDKKAGNKNALQYKTLQQMALCHALQGSTLFASTHWHFVTGMGLPHPIENGMAWHPTLGVPYLTGAAVKGIVRSWLEAWDVNEDSEQQKERLWQWFGSDDKDPERQSKQHVTQAGSLIFFDALPSEVPTLSIDVMTPHMGKWYAEGKTIENLEDDADKIPADWHDPIPIKFLVAKRIHLQFFVAPRNQKCASTIDMHEVISALKDALEWIGAGAKTAVGYGQFNVEQQDVHSEYQQRMQDWQDEREKREKVRKKRKEAQEIAEKAVQEAQEKAKKAAQVKKENAETKAQEDQEIAEAEERRAKMSLEDAFRDALQDTQEHTRLTEDNIAIDFGKGFNKTINNNKYGEKEAVIRILMQEKSQIICQWKGAERNTAKHNAYRRLKEYLSFGITIMSNTTQVTHYDLKQKVEAITKIALAQYKSMHIDDLLLLGKKDSHWSTLLTPFEDDDDLAEDLLAIMEAEEEGNVQQALLDPFNEVVSTYLSTHCELFVINSEQEAQQILQQKVPQQNKTLQQTISQHFT